MSFFTSFWLFPQKEQQRAWFFRSSGGIVSPGEGVQVVTTNNLTGAAGTLNIVGTLTLSGGSSLTENIVQNPVNPTPLGASSIGVAWDSVSAGTLNIASLSPTNKFTVNLANLVGDTTIFDPTIFNQRWLAIINTSAPISQSIVSSDFTINTANFDGGAISSNLFALQVEGNGDSIDLVFTVPEPATVALFAGLAALGLAFIRRRRLLSKSDAGR